MYVYIFPAPRVFKTRIEYRMRKRDAGKLRLHRIVPFPINIRIAQVAFESALDELRM
jgi:hypothetical protein